MRVLFIHNHYRQRGGEDAVLAAEMALLKRAGHQAEAFSLDSNAVAAEPLLQRGLRYAQVPWSFREAARLRAHCAGRTYDVAHIHNLSPFLSASVLGALPAALPRVRTLHNFRAFCANGLFLRDGKPCEDCPQGTGLEGVLHRCHQGSLASSALLTLARGAARLVPAEAAIDLSLCPSRFLLDKHVRYGHNPECLRQLPNAVEDPGVQAGSPARGLFLGRFSHEKGAGVLAEALALLPKGVLLAAGEGPLAPALAERARLLGWLDPAGVKRAFQRVGFLVCPSTTYENQPLAVLEALARGLPVLATDSGALRELVRPGVNGILVPPGDAPALARGIAQMLAMGPLRRRRLGAAGRRLYLKRHSPQSHLKGLLAAYRSAAKRRTR